MNESPDNSDNLLSDVDVGKPNRIAPLVVSTLIIAVTVPTVTYLILYFTAGSTSRAPAIASPFEEAMNTETAVPAESQQSREPAQFADEPGLENGRFYAAEEVIIPAETMVIGVEVGGSFRAYLPGGMNDMDQHVLHDDFNGEPITVTYCDKSDCARVFVRGDVAADQIHMGGFNGVALLLLIDEKRYVQSDQEMPLDEYPIKRVTWFEWKTAHPETTIYVGIGLAYTQTLRDGDDQLPQDACGAH
jgi:hypothetical protein